ncbi:MAG: hypothetical protein RLZZ577_327 [Bacteroidota bacterium]
MKIIVVFCTLFVSFFGFGQELYPPVTSQYLSDNPFVLSPIFAGIGDNLRLRVNGLTQWVGYLSDGSQAHFCPSYYFRL